jgi:serine/threonine protein kinase
MADPRDTDSIEPTLVPENSSVSAAGSPDTAAHPAAHEATLKPAAVNGSRSLASSASLTEAEQMRGPRSFAAPVDATQLPSTASGTATGDQTIGNAPQPSHHFPPPTSGTQVGRFALRSLHARGGLGEVFTARDTELNREVALKRIQTRFADDPASRRRFLTEAELTARLDHPGVVPVFGLVSDGFGRPCYAMRFIRGETLKDEIERYHGSGKSASRDTTAPEGAPDSDKRPEPPAEIRGQPRSVAFRHLVQRFIAVCQAIAYAHTRKVIHRDIKPANVMVGTFGETLVVDWGLAKALDDGPDPEQLLKAAASTGFRHDPEATELPDNLTMAGMAVGTPAYMAPEQASGRIDLVGPAADIYSLGATLFAILTGKSPFSGEHPTETLEKVRRGEFPQPQEVNPEAPAQLNAICCKAMALRIEDRYATALELAADVERWCSDEPVSCYRDPFGERLARWARRHPARVAAAVSLLLAGVLGAIAVASAVGVEQQKTKAAYIAADDARKDAISERNRAQDAEARTAASNESLKKEKEETERQRNRVEASRDLARKRYEAAVAAYNTLVVDIQRRLAGQAGTQEFRHTLLNAAQKGLHQLIQTSEGADQLDTIGADRTLVDAHRQMGAVYQLLGNTHEAIKQYELAVRKGINVLVESQRRRLDKEAWAAKQDLGLANLGLGEAQLQAGNTMAAKRACTTAIELFNEIRGLDPANHEASENLAAAFDKLADVEIERGETAEADQRCQAALTIRQKLADEARNDPIVQGRLADSLDQYAEILLRSGRTTEARTVAERCLDIREKASAQLPNQPEATRDKAAAHSRLGEILFDRDDLAGSKKQYEEALSILDGLLKLDTRNAGAKAAQALNYRRLAAVALRTGDLEVAAKNANASDVLCKQIQELDPSSQWTDRELAANAQQLGDVLLARGQAAQAVTQYQRSVRLLGAIAEKDADSMLAKLALAHALEEVGVGQLAAGKPTDAVACLTASVKLRKQVPDSARAKREQALGLGLLSDAYQAAGDFKAAREALAEEVSLLRQVVSTDKDSRPAQQDLALATGKWGEMLQEDGKPTVALVAMLRSLDQFQALADSDPKNARMQAELAAAWERLAGLYAQIYAHIGQADPATAAGFAALKIRTALAAKAGDTPASRRDLATAMLRLADVYTATSQFEEAHKLYVSARDKVKPDPNDVVATATVHRADDKLALLDAIAIVLGDPGRGLTRVPRELQPPAIVGACDWLLKTKKPVTAENLALDLAVLGKEPENKYRAALILARCAGLSSIPDQDRERYAQEAVQALQAARKAGFNKAQLLDRSEWDPCRNLDGFQKVAEELKRNG